MKSILGFILLAGLAFASTAAASNAPDAVNNLQIGTGRTTATAEFTIPWDDGPLHRPTWIQVRRFTNATDAANWNGGTIVSSDENIVGSGNTVCLDLNGITTHTCNTTYYWAVKTFDEEDNESAVSNVVTAATLGCSPSNPEVTCYNLLPRKDGPLAPAPVEAKGVDVTPAVA